jgi:virginiamycin B lyase
MRALRTSFWAAVVASLPLATPMFAQTPSLSGQVTSADEGAMEGVVVTAKKPGSTVAVSVVSDEMGRFSFPSNRLDAGDYTLRIRAMGYELDGPKSVTLSSSGGAVADLKLRKTRNLSTQLTNAEWMMSVPGTPEQKLFLDRCTSCHTLERAMKSTYNADDFLPILLRMGSYAPGTQPTAPQKRLDIRASNLDVNRLKPRAEFLATINLSSAEKWEYPLKTLPRPKGNATHVVITEYDLPRSGTMPHDVVMDADGMLWYSDFGQQYLGKLDPQTTKVTEYPVPLLKPNFPTGMLDLEIDKNGDIWVGMMLQAGIAKFDRRDEKIQTFGLPPEINNNGSQQAMVMPLYSHVDGKVWMNSVGITGMHRLDLASGRFETFEPYKTMPKTPEHSVYGIKADSKNNLFFLDFSGDFVGKIDAKSGAISLFKTPTPNSNPRRGYMDAEDRLWFTEYRVNKLAMFDTKTEKFEEWELPTNYTLPYDVMPDKNGELWTGGMSSDRVIRFDPKSGRTVEYLLPRPTNIRRVFVDNSTTPVTFWTGSNHGASIIKLEPLD